MHATAAAYGAALVPVVKGNGYGFGRAVLHEVAATLADTVCVGTVHELDAIPPGVRAVVLTPTLPGGTSRRGDVVVTVDRADQLHGASHVIVKLASSMRRYGVHLDALHPLLAAVADSDATLTGYAIHLPLAGTDDQRCAEVEAWLRHLPADGLPLWVSHLAPATVQQLAEAHPDRPIRIRVGTALWHGAPRGDFLHLDAPVLHTEPIAAGERAGYRATPAPADGTLVCIGAGSAHGVTLLDHDDPARRSPFHFGRHRLVALERPHMHTTMCVVPAGNPCPQVGDWVDVQQPLIHVHPDEIDWQP